MNKQKKLSVKEIRMKLHHFENELRKYSGSNKLVNKYLVKVTYMMMWLRLININKDILNGWGMPDYNNINEFRKIGILKSKDKRGG